MIVKILIKYIYIVQKLLYEKIIFNNYYMKITILLVKYYIYSAKTIIIQIKIQYN